MRLPTILVIDDDYGRVYPHRRNPDRQSFCVQCNVLDVTGDENGKPPGHLRYLQKSR